MSERHHDFPPGATANSALTSLIPAQHREIEQWITRLESFGERGIDSEQFLEALQAIENVLMANTVTEEKLLEGQTINPQLIAQHIKSHNQILEYVANIYFLAMERSHMTARTVAQRLRQLITDHITHLDAQLGTCNQNNQGTV